MKQSELWKTEDRTSYTNRHQLLSILPRKTYKNPPRKVIKKNIILELRNLNKKIKPKLLEKLSHKSSAYEKYFSGYPLRLPSLNVNKQDKLG